MQKNSPTSMRTRVYHAPRSSLIFDSDSICSRPERTGFGAIARRFCGGRKVSGVRSVFLIFRSYFLIFALVREADAQRLQEAEVGCSERSVHLFRFFSSLRIGGLEVELIQTDRGFQHQQYIEPLLADVLDHSGNVLRLRDGLMDRFTELLYEIFDVLIQCHLRAALYASLNRASGIPGPT